MEFLANPDLKNVAQGATPTGSTKVAVLEGANNTIKYRSVDDIVSAGGGTTAPRDFQATLYGSESGPVDVLSAKNSYGWPWDGIGDQADSKLRCTKFVIPFKFANYRVSANCRIATHFGTNSPSSSGDFGLKFQYATTNSTSDGDWTDLCTLSLNNKSIGDFASVNGTVSIAGSPTLLYIRVLPVNTLASPSQDADITVRNLIANFWS